MLELSELFDENLHLFPFELRFLSNKLGRYPYHQILILTISVPAGN